MLLEETDTRWNESGHYARSECAALDGVYHQAVEDTVCAGSRLSTQKCTIKYTLSYLEKLERSRLRKYERPPAASISHRAFRPMGSGEVTRQTKV